jgi:hypothetical protein
MTKTPQGQALLMRYEGGQGKDLGRALKAGRLSNLGCRGRTHLLLLVNSTAAAWGVDLHDRFMYVCILGPQGEIPLHRNSLGVQNYFSSGLNKGFSINLASSPAVFFRVLRRRRNRNGPPRLQGLSRRTIAYKD